MNNYYSDIEKLIEVKKRSMKRDYDGLIRAGVQAQIEKLNMNEHKRGFDDVDPWYAYTRIRDELHELEYEVHEKDFYKMRKEAADIANFAHMIIYRCNQELNK